MILANPTHAHPPQIVTHFLPLEETLDDAVGQEVELHLERGGQAVGVLFSLSVPLYVCVCVLS
jgi:hypothetical protein